ncbi:SH3 and multiple ankyrin repeat domains protein 2 [Myotis davidii]|uniref:SH3 and multiple ankyrin repeat domains protein 2 n=1 Tax=Myotis davidii TaxID=225400 RepID=L5MJ11_MYODS|nr:SH3 and multiple ankyrin repeat domains protein 2 [Myotis davidii]
MRGPAHLVWSLRLGPVTLLSDVSLPRADTRADRGKKLFRHYTVGSYDSFDACREQRAASSLQAARCARM